MIANAIVLEPSAIPGSQRCFCSGVPKRLITVQQIAGLTTIISSGHPSAAMTSHVPAAALQRGPDRRHTTTWTRPLGTDAADGTRFEHDDPS